MMGNDHGAPMNDCGSEDDDAGRGQGERQKKTHRAMNEAHASERRNLANSKPSEVSPAKT